MTMVPFSCYGASPIFSHLLVLTCEKNHLGFVGLFPERALEAKLLYPCLHVFLATAAASQKLFQSDVKLVPFAFIYNFFFFLTLLLHAFVNHA